MTRMGAHSEALRSARSRLSLSWEATRDGWRDSRAREYEQRFHVSLDRTAAAFEREIGRLDSELASILRDLPR